MACSNAYSLRKYSLYQPSHHASLNTLRAPVDRLNQEKNQPGSDGAHLYPGLGKKGQLGLQRKERKKEKRESH